MGERLLVGGEGVGAASGPPPGVRLLTVGHGTAGAGEFADLLRGAGVELLVDVRTAPGSRRLPHFRLAEMARWLPEAGVRYRWERDLGGFRKTAPGSPHTALRNDSFRGYADYMGTEAFRRALARVLDDAARQRAAVMCAESLWWRCHRRMIADAAVLLHGAQVLHLGHDGRLTAHRPAAQARRGPDGGLRYDVG